MQGLGLARGLRRCADVYGDGVVGSVSPARNREQVRSRCCGGVPNIQRRSREGEERSMATFSLAVDLPEGSGSPAMDWMRLLSGEELQVSGKRGGSK
jgi:hypothetical protein